MKRDGWWWHDASLTNKAIRRQILKEMLAQEVRALNRRASSGIMLDAFDMPRLSRIVIRRSGPHDRNPIIRARARSLRIAPAMTALKTWMLRDVCAKTCSGTSPGMTKSGAFAADAQACLTCFSRPGSISSPFIRHSGAL